MKTTLFRLVIASFVFAGAQSFGQQRSWFSNLSFRALVSPEEPLIVGFVVRGDPDQQIELLVRAAGPSLAQFGVADTHPCPRLEMYSPDGRLLAGNSGWDRDIVPDPSGKVAPVIVAQNLLIPEGFRFPPGSKDSMLHLTLRPGLQTVHIKPADGVSRGTALFELYSATRANQAHLINLSVLATIGPDRTIIAGLIMKYPYGDRSPEMRNILVRAVGPSLAQFGVGNAHPNPKVEIYTASGLFRTTIGRWELSTGTPSVPELMAKFHRAQSSSGAFPLPSGSMDAAMFLELAPFTWTFHVKPAGNSANSTGVVLFELYDVPQGMF